MLMCHEGGCRNRAEIVAASALIGGGTKDDLVHLVFCLPCYRRARKEGRYMGTFQVDTLFVVPPDAPNYGDAQRWARYVPGEETKAPPPLLPVVYNSAGNDSMRDCKVERES